ncbi:helix-turn-helix domain-containing protein [Paucilactobacillus kaifaensis]|uniref:helix-turn-helix domain-containing protein n=1 Tax=Paucilactobacillus kaifaensis TaxID=2559921 RepID=UPI0010F98166|nr:helix-turn-helix transcriptional regulator [Paucilactobacillus kaifaensis]
MINSKCTIKKEVRTLARENKPALALKIAELRNNRNLTQKALAEALDFSKQEISNWETGLKTPRIAALSKIAEYFDVTLSELLDERLDITNVERTARVLATHLNSQITTEELTKITKFMDQFAHNNN